MAVLFMDSCDHYYQADALKKYHQITNLAGTSTLSAANSGASAWPAGGGVQVWAGAVSSAGNQWNGTTNEATVIMGGWFYFTGTPTGVSNYMFGGFDAGTNQWYVARDTSNHLVVNRNNTGTLLATSTNTFAVNTWYFIEAKITTHNTIGTYEVRVNGSATNWIAAATGANTRATANNYTNMYIFGQTGNNGTATSWRSVYILNTSGSASSDFLGVNMVRCLRPVGPGNYAQWTSNVGTNYVPVSDALGDSDLSFTQSATANQIDSFLFQDLPSAGSVFGLQHVLMARQDGAAARTIAPFQRVPGASPSDFVGANKLQAGSYLFHMDPQTANPATTAPWTVSEVNAAEFGYKLIS